ncbi:MAG: YncE family protein [Dehalococcoidia bacterium]
MTPEPHRAVITAHGCLPGFTPSETPAAQQNWGSNLAVHSPFSGRKASPVPGAGVLLLLVTLLVLGGCAGVGGPRLAVADIALSGSPGNLAVSADGKRLFVANGARSGIGSIVVVDLDEDVNSIVAEIPLDAPVTGMTVDRNGDVSATVDLSGYGGSGALLTVDATTFKVDTTPISSGPRDVSVGSAGQLYIAHNSVVSVVRPSRRSATIDVNAAPLSLIRVFVNAAGTTACAIAAGDTSGAFLLIDTDTRTIVRRVSTEEFPDAGAFSPDGRVLYIAEESRLSVFDASSGEYLRQIPLSENPIDFALAPDGRTAYLANQLAGSVSIVDLEAGELVNEVGVGKSPVAIALSPDGRRLYVSNSGSATVSVVALDGPGTSQN